MFYVGSRGHHADIGGITPGSMPPDSRSVEQEGVLIDNARRKLTRKRGGGDARREPLEFVAAPEPDEELLALDEALRKFAEQPVTGRIA